MSAVVPSVSDWPLVTSGTTSETPPVPPEVAIVTPGPSIRNQSFRG